jgi:hypothetical protein
LVTVKNCHSSAPIVHSVPLTLPIFSRRLLGAAGLRTGDLQRAEGQMVRTCCSAAVGPIEIEL